MKKCWNFWEQCVSLGLLSSGKAQMNTGGEGHYASVLWKYLTKAVWNLDGIRKGFNIWISQDGLLLVHGFLDKF